MNTLENFPAIEESAPKVSATLGQINKYDGRFAFGQVSRDASVELQVRPCPE